MKTRILSGLAMVPLAAIVYFGSWPLLIANFIISIVALKEFYNAFSHSEMMGEKPIRPSQTIGYFVVALIYVQSVVGLLFIQGIESKTLEILSRISASWVYIAAALCLLYLFKINERKLEDSMATLLGIFYVGYFSHFIFKISMQYTAVPTTFQFSIIGHQLVWLVFIAAFGTDIFAYFTGYFLGKHKLCPNISPKKTIEGAVGGALGSMILCGVFGFFVIKPLLVHCIIIGLLGSVVAQLGDLTASIFKRKLGIKDYGNLIPGHGGVLDRFDSVIFVAPFVYYYISLVIPFSY